MIAPQTAVSEQVAEERNLMMFRLDQQTYALPIEPIAQIIPMVAITPLPQVSHVVEGIINVRGRVVPVVNLRRHLGMRETPRQLHTPIMLVDTSHWTLGLIVDEVVDVLAVPEGDITRPTDILPEGLGNAPVLRGLARGKSGIVLLLDLEQLFRPDQIQALAEAMEALPDALPSKEEAPVDEPKPARKRRSRKKAKEASKKADESADAAKPAAARAKKRTTTRSSKKKEAAQPSKESNTPTKRRRAKKTQKATSSRRRRAKSDAEEQTEESAKESKPARKRSGKKKPSSTKGPS